MSILRALRPVIRAPRCALGIDLDVRRRVAGLYRLTLEARKRVEQPSLSRRQLARRQGTSVPQPYRLLDQTNYRKFLHQLVALLAALDREVQLKVRKRSGRNPPGWLAGSRAAMSPYTWQSGRSPGRTA